MNKWNTWNDHWTNLYLKRNMKWSNLSIYVVFEKVLHNFLNDKNHWLSHGYGFWVKERIPFCCRCLCQYYSAECMCWYEFKCLQMLPSHMLTSFHMFRIVGWINWITRCAFTEELEYTWADVFFPYDWMVCQMWKPVDSKNFCFAHD